MVPRITSFLIGVLGLASLRAQYDALPPGPLPGQLWLLAGSYAVLTVFGATAAMMAVARGWRIGALWSGGLVVAVALAVPGGSMALPDAGLHWAFPLAVLLWWLSFAPKGRHTGLWLLWPTLYGGYALLRGRITGLWPCSALDADTLGWPQALANAALLLLAAAVIALAVDRAGRYANPS